MNALEESQTTKLNKQKKENEQELNDLKKELQTRRQQMKDDFDNQVWTSILKFLVATDEIEEV